MLRHITQLSSRAGCVAARRYTTTTTTAAASPVRRAVGPLRRLSALPNAGVAVASLSVCAAAPRRWCASTAPPPSSADPSTAAAGAGGDAPASPPVPSTPSSTPSVAEQLNGLSPEDQQRILAALQHPEQEKSSVMGGGGIGPTNADMVAAFTCGPCNFRMVKRFSKHAYTKGIVIVECPNCRAKHLLADNLGWLEDEAKNIEDILREKGEQFIRIGDSAGDFQVVAGEESAEAGGAEAAAAATTASAVPPSPAQG